MFFLRRATERDCELIYSWVNDVEVRENAFNSEFIPYYEHYNWYKNSLNNKNRLIYIGIDGNREIGQVRLDKDGDKGIISYIVSKSNRGVGYGKFLIKLVKEEAAKNNIAVLEALVKKNNIASQRVFIKNGFSEYEEEQWFRYVFFLRSR